MRLHPFRAVRPEPARAARVASVPYDVVSRDEARRLAAANSDSFLHIGRSDIDLPDDTDPHDPRVYELARETLDRFLRDGVLRRDEEPGVFLYRQVMDGRAQTGVVACVHVDDYERDIIRKHENTRPDKEDDRTRHTLTLNANAEPVFLAYRDDGGPDSGAIAALIGRDTRGNPLYDITADDGVRHTVWRASDPAAYVGAFGVLPVVYVADGHHRSASAWRAGKKRRAANPEHTGEEEYNWFLAALFPASQLRILPYNRLVKDLSGMTPVRFTQELRTIGRLEPTDDPTPRDPGTFCVYTGGRWYRLTVDPDTIDRADPIRSLDVSLLQDRVLGPVLGVGDPRTDPRIDFVGGGRGIGGLTTRVDSGEMAVAVSMYPTTLQQLMAVADAGQVMPPKSTWFEPKLRSGLLLHTLD